MEYYASNSKLCAYELVHVHLKQKLGNKTTQSSALSNLFRVFKLCANNLNLYRPTPAH